MYLGSAWILLPFWELTNLWRSGSAQQNDLLIYGIIAATICIVVPWQVAGLWVPFVYGLLLLLTIWHFSGAVTVGLVALIVPLICLTVRYYDRSSAITLEFPLKRGLYYTAHGGAFPLTNYHGIFVRAQRYACDFVRLNGFGTRARGIHPSKLENYSIYGVTVHSPGAGIILRSVDGLPDVSPGKIDTDNVAGNHVIIRLDGTDVNVLLAHMKNSSVLVKTGDRVSAGQEIGKVGNSGRTSEPHLHIHAQRQITEQGEPEWVPVPMRFGSRWLVRNSLVVS